MMGNKHHDGSKANAEAKDEAELKTETKDGEEGDISDGKVSGHIASSQIASIEAMCLEAI